MFLKKSKSRKFLKNNKSRMILKKSQRFKIRPLNHLAKNPNNLKIIALNPQKRSRNHPAKTLTRSLKMVTKFKRNWKPTRMKNLKKKKNKKKKRLCHENHLNLSSLPKSTKRLKKAEYLLTNPQFIVYTTLEKTLNEKLTLTKNWTISKKEIL